MSRPYLRGGWTTSARVDTAGHRPQVLGAPDMTHRFGLSDLAGVTLALLAFALFLAWDWRRR